jgi:adenylyltransferase/sulfurtransferase
MGFEDFRQMGNSYDLILDGTDNLPVRAEIDRYAKELGISWIYGSVEAFHGQVCFFEQSSFESMNISEHTPVGIAAPMVMHIGSLQANMALRYLTGLDIAKDKLHYLYFNKDGELVMQKFSMPVS